MTTVEHATAATDVSVARLPARVAKWSLDHAIFSMLLVFVVVFAIVSPAFGSLSNGRVILLAASASALLAMGEAFVILTGGIDLSVGSVVGLSGVAGALAARNCGSAAVATVVAVAVGLAAGLFNGLVVAFARVPPFIVTLGSMTIALGVGQVLSHGSPVSGLPERFIAIANNSYGGIPVPVMIMVVAFLVLWLLLARTGFGMHVYAVGGNPLAARIAGINERRILLAVYTLAGVLAGLAGLILASRVTAGIATTGTGYELDAIAAVVIGGISLMGGRGSIAGALIGVLIIATLNNGLDILNVSPFYQDIVKGILIIAAVFVDVRVAHRTER